jgi:L-ascorbate metabolism protein UlaG (beta-lactamase superfamily)
MEITWYGHSCFRLSERGKSTVITDPYAESIGYGPLNLKGDIVTVSHETAGHANWQVVRESRLVISRPGEYELGGVLVVGVAMINRKAANPRYNITYLLDFGQLNVVHLGDLDYVPSQSELDALGEIHVALVPVGGGGALSSGQAAEVIAMLEPGIVIPMHYHTPHSLLDLAPVDKFLTEMGVTTPEVLETFKVTSSAISEQTQVVLLDYKMKDMA